MRSGQCQLIPGNDRRVLIGPGAVRPRGLGGVQMAVVLADTCRLLSGAPRRRHPRRRRIDIELSR